MADESNSQEPWQSRLRYHLVLCGFLTIAVFFLWTEHRAHLFGVLPYLLLFACPLMLLFMHRGHDEHGYHSVPKEGKP